MSGGSLARDGCRPRAPGGAGVGSVEPAGFCDRTETSPCPERLKPEAVAGEPTLPCPIIDRAIRAVRGRPAEAGMHDDTELDAEIDALGHLTSAVVDVLTQLRTASTAAERAALRAEFDARIDRLLANLGARHGLDERRAGAT